MDPDTNVKMSAVPEPNKMSIDDFSKLVNGDEEVLLDFLADLGVIAKYQTCSNCGDNMRRFFDKSKNQTFWICTKSKNGVKCKGGKFSIRKGTFLQNVHLSIQQVLWYIWHFVHELSVKQCREYMSIGKYNKETVVEAYKSCRAICNDWIRENFEPLGGFGTIVEFDESYFSGAPKYGRGGRGHAPSWEEENPWVFGIVQRGSLDCWLQQVTNRRRTTLVPILNSRLKQGSVLCSDKWGAYKELEQHLTVEDCEHFTVNHKKNFVDPDTGAYTQTVEGMWRHMKVFLPPYGIPPRYLDSYLGAFMWIRYAKQQDLDLFFFFFWSAQLNKIDLSFLIINLLIFRVQQSQTREMQLETINVNIIWRKVFNFLILSKRQKQTKNIAKAKRLWSERMLHWLISPATAVERMMRLSNSSNKEMMYDSKLSRAQFLL